MIDSVNMQPPFMGPQRPLYPHLLQLVRVTGGTVPGPSGFASSSAAQPSLYLGSTQQLDPTVLVPRDREPCLVLDVNRFGLAPGYYLGRLASSYQSLPVYEVGGSSSSALPLALVQNSGLLTPAQVQSIATLTPAQISVLSNLNPCQLSTLFTGFPLSQIQTLTLSLTATQLTNFINQQTVDQAISLYTQLTTSQVRVISSALNANQLQTFATILTPAKVLELVTSLSSSQLLTLAELPAGYLQYLTTALTTTQIRDTLDELTAQQTTALLGFPAGQIATLVTNLTISQLQTLLGNTPQSSIIPSRVNTQTGTTYTVGASDLGKMVLLTNAGAKTVALPAANFLNGFITYVQNPSATATTVTPTSGTINGAASLTIPAGTGASIWSDGTNWQVSTPTAGATSSSGARTEVSVAADGTTQGTAALITTSQGAAEVTGADGTKGVILTDAAASDVLVWNNSVGPNSLKVYPPSGASFGATGANIAIVLGGQTASNFNRVTSTIWRVTATDV